MFFQNSKSMTLAAVVVTMLAVTACGENRAGRKAPPSGDGAAQKEDPAAKAKKELIDKVAGAIAKIQGADGKAAYTNAQAGQEAEKVYADKTVDADAYAKAVEKLATLNSGGKPALAPKEVLDTATKFSYKTARRNRDVDVFVAAFTLIDGLGNGEAFDAKTSAAAALRLSGPETAADVRAFELTYNALAKVTYTVIEPAAGEGQEPKKVQKALLKKGQTLELAIQLAKVAEYNEQQSVEQLEAALKLNNKPEQTEAEALTAVQAAVNSVEVVKDFEAKIDVKGIVTTIQE